MLARTARPLYVRGVPKLIRRLTVLVAIAAFASATSGADLVDLLTCGVEETSDCGSVPEPGADSEGSCDHCPSCVAGHGHMQSLLAPVADLRPSVSGAGVIAGPPHRAARLAAQDIFHPPIAPPL